MAAVAGSCAIAKPRMQSPGAARPGRVHSDAVIRAARLRSATALQAKGLAGCAAVG
jgi:hypothetical protein